MGLFFILQMTYKSGEPHLNDNDRIEPNDLEKSCSSATLSTTNPVWTDPGANRDSALVGD
jgi:hypothetical protein